MMATDASIPFFVALLLATGNRVGAAGGSERRAHASAHDNTTKKTLLVFGDSLSAGYGLEPGQSYPDDLQRALDAQGYPWRVVNLGVSGDTTDGRRRAHGYGARRRSRRWCCWNLAATTACADCPSP